MRHALLTIALLAGVGGVASAQAPDPRIADLAWLEGHWSGVDGLLQMEEIWTSAAGDALVGLHKDVSSRGGAARMVSFEFLRIERGPEGIAYVAVGAPPMEDPHVGSEIAPGWWSE